MGRENVAECAQDVGFSERGLLCEKGGECLFDFAVDGFPRGEPVGIGFRSEKGAKFGGVSLYPGREAARGIDEKGTGTYVYVVARLNGLEPTERGFRRQPVSEMEDEIGAELRSSFEDPVVVAYLLFSGKATRI
jgi:hypothetical protein